MHSHLIKEEGLSLLKKHYPVKNDTYPQSTKALQNSEFYFEAGCSL